jgi:pyruvate kinase
MMMQVTEVNGEDVVCLVKNSATLSGLLYTLHVSQIHINLPTLTDKDKEVFVSTRSYMCCYKSLY